MKILALGGAGDMGRMAVAVLLDSPNISSVTVADINYTLASTFVKMVDSPKLSAVRVDITEKKKLIDLIKKHDIVLNTVGPFYKFETVILEAVIKAKKPLIDICDDWKPTLNALKFNDKAKKAGITAIIGIGASPGITNILAVYASSMLDEIDELITAWGLLDIDVEIGIKPKYFIETENIDKMLEASQKKPNAAYMHFIYETIEKIPTFKDGKMIEIDSLTEAKPLDFPGFKSVYACHIGHPEPITLSRTIKAKSISNVCHLGKTATEIARKYSQKVRNKELTIEEATLALQAETSELIEQVYIYKNKELLSEYVGGPKSPSAIATGMKGGKRKKVAVALARKPYGGMAGETGIPLGIATLMLIEGKITQKGVITPEQAFKDNPMEFFNRLAPYCGTNLTGKDILIEKVIDL